MSSQIAVLERVIIHLDTLYETGQDCLHPDTGILVSDGEYDKMRRELEKLAPNSHVFSNPTASLAVGVAKKIKHDPPLTSISKASHEDLEVQEDQLFKWVNDCLTSILPTKKKYKIERNGKVVSEYPAATFYQAYKLDGAACGLYYKNGELVAAGLRPRDGVNGEDITEQVKFVAGIPQKLKLPVTCSIRGELICKLSDFELVQQELAAAGEKLRANPRNHAAGGIRQFKDPTKVKDMRLSFIGHSVEGLTNPPYKTEIERAKWCNKDLGISFVQAREYNFHDLKKMEDNVPNLDYEVDGVVIGVDNIEDQEQLGRHGDNKTGNPKGKIAWKFAEERAHPVVKDKEWNTGRTGAIKPVAIFDAVSLAGTQVGRATLHNLGFIFRNKIKVDTAIVVLKAGKIIPKVVGVMSNQADYKKIDDVDYPRHCPSCNCKTVVKHTPAKGSQEEMYELTCPNVADCPAQNVNRLCHFLDTIGVLGLGDSKVTALVESGQVKSYADFFTIDETAGSIAGLSKRQTLLAIAGIYFITSPDKYDDDELKKKIAKAQKQKLSIPLWKLFASFGIESAGKSAGKALVDHFQSFDKIRKATAQELAAIPNVGDKTAQIVAKWLADNEKEIDNLLNYIEPELPQTGPLTGKTFVLTGGFAEGKKYWEAAIEAQGGKCSSSVGQSTNHVVEGVDAGSKADKARALKIDLITVDGLKKILGI